MNPEKLKLIRQSLKLTQAKLAKELGVTREHVLRMEKGIYPISKITELAMYWLSIDHTNNRKIVIGDI